MSAARTLRRAPPAGGTVTPPLPSSRLALYTTRPHLPEAWEAEPLSATRLAAVGEMLVLRAHHACAGAVLVTPRTTLDRLITELRALADMLAYGPDPQAPAAVATMPDFRP